MLDSRANSIQLCTFAIFKICYMLRFVIFVIYLRTFSISFGKSEKFFANRFINFRSICRKVWGQCDTNIHEKFVEMISYTFWGSDISTIFSN